MFPEEIETDRLLLERFCRSNPDVFELYRVLGVEVDDEVFRYVTSTPYDSVKDAYDDLRQSEREWDEGEKAKYIIRPRDKDVIAGTASLKCMWEKRTGRLGIKLRKPFWGRGYSGERADALIKLAFERLDLEYVTAGYQDDNEKSKKAIEGYIERHGGSYDGVLRNWVPMDDEVHDLNRYTISQDEYREAKEKKDG